MWSTVSRRVNEADTKKDCRMCCDQRVRREDKLEGSMKNVRITGTSNEKRWNFKTLKVQQDQGGKKTGYGGKFSREILSLPDGLSSTFCHLFTGRRRISISIDQRLRILIDIISNVRYVDTYVTRLSNVVAALFIFNDFLKQIRGLLDFRRYDLRSRRF